MFLPIQIDKLSKRQWGFPFFGFGNPWSIPSLPTTTSKKTTSTPAPAPKTTSKANPSPVTTSAPATTKAPDPPAQANNPTPSAPAPAPATTTKAPVNAAQPAPTPTNTTPPSSPPSPAVDESTGSNGSAPTVSTAAAGSDGTSGGNGATPSDGPPLSSPLPSGSSWSQPAGDTSGPSPTFPGAEYHPTTGINPALSTPSTGAGRQSESKVGNGSGSSNATAIAVGVTVAFLVVVALLLLAFRCRYMRKTGASFCPCIGAPRSKRRLSSPPDSPAPRLPAMTPAPAMSESLAPAPIIRSTPTSNAAHFKTSSSDSFPTARVPIRKPLPARIVGGTSTSQWSERRPETPQTRLQTPRNAAGSPTSPFRYSLRNDSPHPPPRTPLPQLPPVIIHTRASSAATAKTSVRVPPPESSFPRPPSERSVSMISDRSDPFGDDAGGGGTDAPPGTHTSILNMFPQPGGGSRPSGDLKRRDSANSVGGISIASSAALSPNVISLTTRPVPKIPDSFRR